MWKVKRNHSAVNGGEADFYLLKIKFPAASWASRFCSPYAMACSVLRRRSPKGKNHHQTAVARNQTIRATCNVNERKRSIIRFHYTGSSLPGALLDFQLSVDFVSCSKSISEVKKGLLADRLRLSDDKFARLTTLFYEKDGELCMATKRLRYSPLECLRGPERRQETRISQRSKRRRGSCRSSSINSRENARNFKGKFSLFTRRSQPWLASWHSKKALLSPFPSTKATEWCSRTSCSSSSRSADAWLGPGLLLLFHCSRFSGPHSTFTSITSLIVSRLHDFIREYFSSFSPRLSSFSLVRLRYFFSSPR